MALAQGSGELIWWPYIIAKYGLTFLFLLLPACLLQFPIIFEIGRYTVFTGESIFQGFIRLNRFFALGLWLLMTLSFLWFGAFATAGGTSLAALTNFPSGWSPQGQTLFWGYCSMTVFLVGILLSRVIYRFLETFMWAGCPRDSCWPAIGERQPGCFASPAGISQALNHPAARHAASMGCRRCDKAFDRRHLRWTGRLLDAFLLLLDP
jgi:hypothetical protein